MKRLWSGQSLVEILVALGVTAMVLTALVQLAVRSLSQTSFSRNQALATTHAQKAMEKIRAYWSESGLDDLIDNCSADGLGLALPEDSLFTLTVSCDDCSSGDADCEVETVVLWEDAQGEHRSDLVTVLGQ